jgi:hypothetical protein
VPLHGGVNDVEVAELAHSQRFKVYVAQNLLSIAGDGPDEAAIDVCRLQESILEGPYEEERDVVFVLAFAEMVGNVFEGGQDEVRRADAVVSDKLSERVIADGKHEVAALDAEVHKDVKQSYFLYLEAVLQNILDLAKELFF